jgi:hypothetical protein
MTKNEVPKYLVQLALYHAIILYPFIYALFFSPCML